MLSSRGVGNWLQATGRYVLALAFVVAVGILRWAVDPWVGGLAQYTFFLVSVAVAAAVAGWGPGLLATVAGGAAGHWLFVDRLGHAYHIPGQHHVQLLLYLSVSLLIVALAEWGQRQRERARRRSAELRLQGTALEAAANGMIITDPAGTILWSNPAFAAMTGYRLDEILGANPRLFKSGVHDEAFYHALWDTIGRGEVWHGELVNRRKDGTLYHEEMVIAPVQDEQRRITHYVAIKQDITPRRRAEEELRETAIRYRTVAEHTHDWEFWLAPDGHFLYVSPACQNVTGYPAEAFLRDPDLADRIVHPEDRALYEEHRGRGDEACITEEAEFRIIRRDEAVRWIGHACVPVYDDAGAFLGIRGSNRDITERKEAEEALAESRRRLSGIIDSAMDAIITIDEQQRIVLFNSTAEKMFRCPATEAVGSPVDRLIPERFRAAHRQHIRHFGQTGQTARAMGHLGAISGLRANGEEFPIEASISQVQVGDQKLFTVILRDITERQRAEEALRKSDIRYRALFDAIDEGFCIIEVIFDEHERPIDYRFLEISPSFEKQTGLIAARGKRMRELAPKHEEHWFETYGRIALTGQPARFQNRAEQLGRWYDVYAFRVGRSEDRQVAILFNDITQRRRAEEELVAAYARAEQASKAKDQFLAVLSHELRTPLTPVLAVVSALRDDPRLGSDLREDMELIQRNVALEARLIDDLLDVTRIVRGKVELNRQPVDVCTVIRGAVEVCQADIEARRLHFGVDIGPDAPYIVHADAARLQQVFWNLLKNAIKFTPHDGCVGIRCYAEGIGVRGEGLETERNGGQECPPHRAPQLTPIPYPLTPSVVVEVSDSGEGIDPNLLPYLFQPFEQGGAAITRQFGGLGLGLTITKGLVDMHGGSIEAYSEGKGKGAKFTVRLPMADFRLPNEMPSDVPAKDTQSEIGNRKLAILLVEDHGDTARIMKRLLSSHGHEVQTAADVATALALAEAHPFDLLISDLGLPDGSGVDLMGELRRREQTLPGIALSGYGQEEDLQRTREAGFVAHLTKPVDLEHLKKVIAHVAESGPGSR